ncbi:hypothetical protein evm_003013 [Chilo suppressalis]|nr:hypothetical protein evm_003013 [Chilo suppressalis]
MSTYMPLMFISTTVFVYLIKIIALSNESEDEPKFCTNHYTEMERHVERKVAFNYPKQYLIPGQRRIYFPLPCVKPQQPLITHVTVCDFYAPPHVEITLSETHLYILRRDPVEKYSENAVMTLFQTCPHNDSNPNYEFELSLNQTLPNVTVLFK